MKILFITGSLNQGGAEFQLLQLAKLFQEHKHDVEVFAITDYNFYRPFVEKNNIAYSHLNNDQGKLKRVLLTAKKIKTAQPDLIVSYLKVPSQVAVIARLLSGSKAKLIVGERTSLIQLWYDRFHFNLMRLADSITVNSIVRVNQLKRDFPGLKDKLFFTPNIIDVEKFEFGGLHDNKEVTTIGFVGRVAPEKNLLNLIEAIKILMNQNYNIRLLIYGDTNNKSYLSEVTDRIRINNLEGTVVIKGKTNDINSIYSALDLLCLISDYEGFSNVISEALCSGVPIVTSNVEENRFLIEDGINGFIVDHKDPKNIASGISRYINLNTESKLWMCENNRAKCEKMFDKKILYDTYMELINKFEVVRNE